MQLVVLFILLIRLYQVNISKLGSLLFTTKVSKRNEFELFRRMHDQRIDNCKFEFEFVCANNWPKQHLSYKSNARAHVSDGDCASFLVQNRVNVTSFFRENDFIKQGFNWMFYL